LRSAKKKRREALIAKEKGRRRLFTWGKKAPSCVGSLGKNSMLDVPKRDVSVVIKKREVQIWGRGGKKGKRGGRRLPTGRDHVSSSVRRREKGSIHRKTYLEAARRGKEENVICSARRNPTITPKERGEGGLRSEKGRISSAAKFGEFRIAMGRRAREEKNARERGGDSRFLSKERGGRVVPRRQ